jgi:cobalt-zinc-cadmium efflux system outer membrane protein
MPMKSILPIRAVVASAAVAFAVSGPPALGQENAAIVLRLPQLPEESIARLPAADFQPDALPPGEGQLTLGEVESLAAANYPAVRVADAQLQAARGRWLQAGLPPNPVIGYMGSEIGDEGRGGMQGGYIEQDFITAGKLGLSRAVAAREIAAAEQRLARVRLVALASARAEFFETLAAERAMTLAHLLEGMTSKAVKASELRLQAQEGSGASLLQSQIENESVVLLEQQAANRYEAARRRLSVLIGREGRPLGRLEDSFARPLPALDWESTRARVLGESPVLTEAAFAVESARWGVQRAIAGRIPDVNLQTSVQYDDATNFTVANVQMTVPLPIFDRNQGAIAAAQGELAAAQAALDAKRLALEQRLAAVLRDYLTARQRVNKYSGTILPAAQQSLDMVAKAYEAGELDYLQLLSAQRTFTEKNLAYFEDLRMAWVKWAEIEALLVDAMPDSSN